MGLQKVDDSILSADRKIETQLRITWPVFFQKWGRLREVQRQAIPPIIEGKDVLVCAATASGKTEAVCAPLVERLLESSKTGTILYISPTRALVNDICARLEPALYRLGVSVERRTGEYRQSKVIGRRVLITTPESFDSMLCRGRVLNPAKDMPPHELYNVRAVVMDEIHLLDNSARGEQLQYLLERLDRLQNYLYSQNNSIIHWRKIQRIALSATLAAPKLIAKRYLSQNPLIVSVSGSREIEVVEPDNAFNNTSEGKVVSYIKNSESDQKILIFANTRKRVEELTNKLKQHLEKYEYHVYPHHGSLSKAIREKAEGSVRKVSKIIIVSTSTLEIGIDIGDIDLVVLDAPPPNISAFLQRIGRGNRKTNKTRVLLCWKSKAEKLIQNSMVLAAKEGNLGQTLEQTFSAVARQQIASYIYQSPMSYRSKTRLEEFLSLKFDPLGANALLETMVENEELKLAVSDRYSLAEYWAERVQSGHIHSNIEGVPGTSVIDNDTGEVIATGVKYGGEGELAIAGKGYNVKSSSDFKVTVKQSGGTFAGVSFTSGRYRFAGGWEYAVRDFIGIDENEWPIIVHGKKIYVLHFGGLTMKLTLKLLLDQYPRGFDYKLSNCSIETTAKSWTAKPKWAKSQNSISKIEIEEYLDSFENELGFPIASKELPTDLRMQDLVSAIGIPQKLDLIANSVWRARPELKSREGLLELIV